MNPRPATTDGEGRKSSPTDVVLHGRRLFFARLAWFALAALTVGLFVASVPVAYQQLGTYNVALSIVSVLGFWTIGAILFWKRSDNGSVLLASVVLITYGAIQVDTVHWLAEVYPVWEPPMDLVYFVGEASFFVFFCVFPDGRFVPRWTRWVAVAWITYWLLDSFFPDSPVNPVHWPLVIRAPLLLGLIGSLVVAQIYRYWRVSGPVERQHTKWVVFGFTATIAGFFVVLLIGWLLSLTRTGIPPSLVDDLRTTSFFLFVLFIPLSIGFAMLGYPALLIRTVVYSSLISVVGAVYTLTDLLLVPLLAQSTLGEKDPSLTAFLSVVILVVLFKPLRNRIEAGINRLADWLGGDEEAGSFISPPQDRDEPTPFIRPPSDR